MVTPSAPETAPAVIHDTAIIEEGAEIGPGSRVWHHAHVRRDAKIGALCSLGKNVFIDAAVEIGEGSRIQNNVSVYAGVTLERQVFVGPSAVFTNDRFPRALNPEFAIVPTRVCTGASIGANATVLCGIVVGPWAVIGAGAVVTRDVQAHEVVLGSPARHFGWACECGKTISYAVHPPRETQCPACGRTFSTGS